MDIKDYYHDNFHCDIRRFMPDERLPYFGHTWDYSCSALDQIQTAQRAPFLICLYFTVLVDQAMHYHYPSHYSCFEEMTEYPKFCHGLGQFHKNPREILSVPAKKGLVSRNSLESLLADGMALFVDEVIIFFRSHLKNIEPEEFFKKLIYDPDVQIPLLLVALDRRIKDDIVFKTYEALRDAVRIKFSNIR